MIGTYDKETSELLEVLDREIDMKCAEVKEKRREKRLRNLFFVSCGVVLLIFSVGEYIGLSFVSLLALFFVYQGIAVTLAVPLIFSSLNKEAC